MAIIIVSATTAPPVLKTRTQAAKTAIFALPPCELPDGGSTLERMVLRGKVVPVPVLLVIVAAPGGGSNPWHAAGVHEGTVRYEKGNPDLRPEFSLQGDLGADFSNKYLSASAALFCNRIQNYIFASRTADVTEGHPVYQYPQTTPSSMAESSPLTSTPSIACT